ncbi:unnamed protein product [Rhizophagus irregularis]|uniref:Serine-threonine/tyrosine-protein kinase catalytic domain-containing protein n=1 Tax=Rhizophagus irregularis TaxID=588596 RepID=A0A915ZE80_9GLOM|nr:unnamed protein product [Rhizophagus irregularis]
MSESNDSHRDLCLSLAIIDGLRETPTPLTPKNYIELYRTCWEYEPSKRPTIEQIIETLNNEVPELKDDVIMGIDLVNNTQHSNCSLISKIQNNSDNELEQMKGIKCVTEFFPLKSKKVKLFK